MGGQFDGDIQRATPNYAINDGMRRDALCKETLARMFVPVSADERDRYLESIGDTHVQARLAPQLSGLLALTGDHSGPAPSGDPDRREAPPVRRTGYVDFFIQRAQHSLRENYQVSPTLEGNYVVYSYDQQPPVFPYSGLLINTKQDDQASNFFRLYVHIFRLAQLAKRQKELVLRYDAYIIKGAAVDLTMDYSSEAQLYVPFSFNFLVKQIAVVKYNINWTPTRTDSAISDDPNAVTTERPTRTRTTTTTVATTPLNTELAPTDRRDADLRTENGTEGDVDSGELLASPPTQAPANMSPAQMTTPPTTTTSSTTSQTPALPSTATPTPATPEAHALTDGRPETHRPPATSRQPTRRQAPDPAPRQPPVYRDPSGGFDVRGTVPTLVTPSRNELLTSLNTPTQANPSNPLMSQEDAAAALAAMRSHRTGTFVLPGAPEF